MADLREVIRKAWLDLDSQAAPLRAREAALKEELRSVQQNIGRLMDQVADAEKAAQAIGLDLASVDRAISASPPQSISIKQAIRFVLDANQEGLTSFDLHKAVSEMYFNSSLERTSFSPQLSRMKSAGEVKLDDNHWILEPEGRRVMLAQYEAASREETSQLFIRHAERHGSARDEAGRYPFFED